ncbi:MAG: hypothetical protein PHC43_00135 [Candidatus Marinimicrobia bacterium]|jgi:hypothetical protein|nr:hypothetical protein [Candidatus Neomarinimicrobiota bacterium]
MDTVLVATLISEGGKIISEFIRSNQMKRISIPEVKYPEIPDELPGFTDIDFSSKSRTNLVLAPVNYAPVISVDESGKATGEKVATSCVGCAIGHLATVSGLLKEAVRFVGEGLDSPNIVGRLNTCLDELNAMERVDLLPDKISTLPDWEKELAHKALKVSRETRHYIEVGIDSSEQFEQLAANLINARNEIGNAWLQKRLRAISDKDEVQKRASTVISQLAKSESIPEEYRQKLESLSPEDKEEVGRRVLARLSQIAEENQEGN